MTQRKAKMKTPRLVSRERLAKVSKNFLRGEAVRRVLRWKLATDGDGSMGKEHLPPFLVDVETRKCCI